MSEVAKLRALLVEARGFVRHKGVQHTEDCATCDLFDRIGDALSQPVEGCSRCGNPNYCGGGCIRVGILDGQDGISRCADHDERLRASIEAERRKAFEVGAEKMREAAARLFDGKPGVPGLASMPPYAEALRALPIDPEGTP